MMRKRLPACLLLLLLSAASMLPAQLVTFSNSLRVVEGGDTLLSPWAGGLNVPQVCELDLDNDGVMDLLAFDRVDNTLLPLHYEGGSSYRYAPEFLSFFPLDLIEYWVFTYDYDGDGYRDLLTGIQTSNVRVLRNTSAASGGSLSFAQVKSPVFSAYSPPSPTLTPLYASRTDYSAFTDVDGDTDMDILVFESSGSYVQWHRNTSIENGWGRDSLTFVAQSKCFGHFQEDASGCTAYLDEPPCVTGINGTPADASGRGAVHSGSTLLALDLNADALTDLVIGDASCDYLYALTNGGIPDTAHFVSLEVHYPSADVPVDIYTFPAAFYVDLDHDGARDLVASPNVSNTGEDIHSVWEYHNNGADNLPVFAFSADDLLQRDMIETGSGAQPAFIDFDQDGDHDLIIGNHGSFMSPGTSVSQLSLYLNEGTETMPVFVLHHRDWLGISALGEDNLSPAAADMDGDGDDDLLLGNFDGKLLYYRNNALPGDTAKMALLSSNYASIDAGLFSTPNLVDVDADGDHDLVIGNHRGYLHYYQNNGSASFAVFDSVTGTFGNIKINDESGASFTNGYSHPFVCNLDADAGLEILVGGFTGEVFMFDDVSTTPGANFPSLGKLGGGLDFGNYAAPVAGYRDASAYLRFLVGNYRGGLMLAEGGKPIGNDEPVAVQPEITLFPNPLQADFVLRAEEAGEAVIMDVTGRVMMRFAFDAGDNRHQVASLASGMYLLRAVTPKGSIVLRMVVE